MTIQEVCQLLTLPKSVVTRVGKFVAEYDFEEISDILEALGCPETAEKAYEKLAKVWAEDEDQDRMKMLASQLYVVAKDYDRYLEKGISEQIFVDTFKCFTRFIGECKVKTGKEDFDRAWWTYRQVSMSLFRIGELEYELREVDGKRKIDLHIPSDADFRPERVDASLEQARAFLEKCYPEYTGCDFTCESWLLSPKLKELLSEDSNIIRFRNRFEIGDWNEEAKDVFEWVFKTFPDCELAKLSENTSLQRKMKALLMKGQHVGIAEGILR